VSAQLIGREVAERHETLMRDFAAGVAGACIALWHIREERTYETQGFASFTEFLKSIHFSTANGRLYANSGPVIEDLRTTGDEHLITHVDVLRPIALLLSTKKQSPEKQKQIIKRLAHIVRTAAAVAKKGQEPLTEEVVQRVARKNFGIKSRDEYRAERRAKAAKQAPDDEARRKKMRQDVELAFSVLIGYEDELRRGASMRLDDLRPLVGFERALFLLIDARDT